MSERLALYWRCYGCHAEVTAGMPFDLGAYGCPGCGMTLLLPTYGPVAEPCGTCRGEHRMVCSACMGTGLANAT